jgi:hypothetical protein
VRYETAEAFRTALEQRLKNEAQASGIALLRLRKRVAFRAIPRQARDLGVKRLDA